MVIQYIYIYMCVCVCVCVCKNEKDHFLSVIIKTFISYKIKFFIWVFSYCFKLEINILNLFYIKGIFSSAGWKLRYS